MRIAYSLLRRLFPILAAFLCFSLRAAEKPNFILCMGDDHGWSETGYHGHPHVKTPVLDEMAEAGLRLDRFYAAHPTCSPTRGSVLTGRHPNRFGTFDPGWSIRPEEITIAHLLGGGGYTCGHFGKWHLGPVKADSPTNPGAMGFDTWVSHDNFYEMNPWFSRDGGPPEKYPGEGSEVTVAEAIKFIDATAQQGKPFLAVIWFGSPHEPYSGLDKDLALYDNLPQEYATREVKLTSMETGMPTKRPLRDVLRERYAEITALDRAMGQLRDHLESSGLKDNTLVWYCGDNGAPPSAGRAGNPLRGEKALMYEGGIRVPGLIEFPGRIPEGRISDVPAVTSDMLPTLCDLADVALPDRPLDGISLVPLIDGKMDQRPVPIFFWNYDASRVKGRAPLPEPWIDPEFQVGTTPLVKYLDGSLVRSFTNFHQPPLSEGDYLGPRVIMENRQKLVVGGEKGKGEATELFDLESDPAEEQDLVQDNPEMVSGMEQRLKEWQASVLKSLSGGDYD